MIDVQPTATWGNTHFLIILKMAQIKPITAITAPVLTAKRSGFIETEVKPLSQSLNNFPNV